MKKQIKLYSLTIIFVLVTLIVHGQTSDSSIVSKITKGKWTVCTDIKFSANYKCTNGWTNYNFYENGTFLETQKDENLYGTFKMIGNTLSIKRNDILKDGCYTKCRENIYTIIWLDNSRFYSVSKDGPEGIVYTYFERL